MVNYEFNPKNINQYEYVINTEPNNKLGVNLRPFLKEALVEISKNYFIVIISNCNKETSDLIINLFDLPFNYVSLRLYEEDCQSMLINSEPVLIKDIRVLGVPLTKIVIIDNSVLSFAFHIKNGIPILPFINNKGDNELKILVSYLLHLSQFEDIQEENSKAFRLEGLVDSDDIETSGLDNLNLDESPRFEDSDKEKESIRKIEKIEPIKRNYLTLNFGKTNFNSNSSYESNSLLSCLLLLNKGQLNYDSVYNTNLQVSFDCSGGDSEIEKKFNER